MEYEFLQASKSFITYNNYEYTCFSFYVYADTNLWDGKVADYLDDTSVKDLIFNLTFSSTDLTSTMEYSYFYGNSVSSTDISHLESLDLFTSLYNDMPFVSTNYSTTSNLTITSNNTLNEYYSYSQAETLYFICKDTTGDPVYIDSSYAYTYLYSDIDVRVAYRDGYNNGISTLNNEVQNAYQQGLDEGNENGYNLGYDVGYSKGDSVGFNRGYNNGLNNGREVGYQIGYDVGYLDGVEVAESGEATLSNLVVTVADTPIDVFKSIFDVEFLGINLVPVLFGFASFGLIIWVIKKLI